MDYVASNSRPQKKRGCLSTFFIVAILIPLKLLTNKKVLPVVLIAFLIGLGVWGLPKLLSDDSGNFDSVLDSMEYRYSEGSEKTLDSKIQELTAAGDFEEAAKYMVANEWYTIKDAAVVNTILTSVQEDRLHAGGTFSMVSTKDCQNAQTVLSRIDCPVTREQQEIIDQFHIELGIVLVGSEPEEWLGHMEKCAEGTYGRTLYKGFSLILAGDEIAGAEVLNEYLNSNRDMRYDTERLYENYKRGEELTDLEGFVEYKMVRAILMGVKHSTNNNSFDTSVNSYQMDGTVLSEEIRASLPSQFSKNNQGKLLVLNRVHSGENDEITLDVNCMLMRSIPEKYYPETIADVGYILLIDCGYINDGIWYAGTAKAILYEVATGEEIYTSETLNGEYKEFYYGPETDYIFGTYPELKSIVIPALDIIENAMS